VTTDRDADARDVARRLLREARWEPSPEEANLLARLHGRELLQDFVLVLKEHPSQESRRLLLEELVAELRGEALPAIEALLASGDAASRHEAFQHLIALGEAAPKAAVLSAVRQELAGDDVKAAAGAVRAAAPLAIPELVDDLWPLLDSEEPELRAAAVQALAAIGGAVVDRARPLVSEGASGRLRASAIQLLSDGAAPEDLRRFRERLRLETDAPAREALWSALAAHPWPFSEPLFTGEELRRLLRPAGRRPSLPNWVPEEKLPELRWSGGEALGRAEARALLERFVRRKDVEPDAAAALLASDLEPASARAFGRTLLEAYAGAGADARHRWALAAAAVLGGAGVVTPLLEGALALSEARRTRTAEHFVRALALSPSDEALGALDTLTHRLRGRRERLADAAGEALQEAARRRRLNVEELRDLLVPWLGFSSDGRRQLGGLELLPSAQHSVLYRDPETKQRFARPPRGLSRETLAELRAVSRALAEAGKTQAARLEQEMAEERRWPAARWRALFLGNPVLLPFAIRLVWTAVRPEAAAAVTFRALADRTLTTVGDEELELGPDAELSLAHPVLLMPAEVEAWRAHLDAHGVEPPFAQMERPVAVVTDAERSAVEVAELAGKAVHGFAFRARAEKRRWASTEEGVYLRRFRAADIEARLQLEGFFGGYADEVTLGRLVFRRAGARRRLRLEEVPRVVYSETVGDLRAFASG